MKRWFIRLIIIGFCFSVVASCGVFQQDISNQTNKDKSDVWDLANLYLPPHQDFRIAVISDLNSQYGSTEYEPEVKKAIALMPRWQPDLVLCGGDMIAGQKTSLTQSQIESMWSAFNTEILVPIAQQGVPFGFTIGNHDGSGAVKNQTLIFDLERNLAQAYWQQQELGLNFVDRANFPFYYSFQQDNLFFLVWDASTAKIAPAQLEWVKKALNSRAAQQATARIVVGHLPLYPIAPSKNKPGEYLADGDKLRSLLVKNQVLLYISGHHHAYYPGTVGSLELLHAGALGQGARQLINSVQPSKTVTIIDLQLAKSRITYTTYNAQTWQLISLEQLPASISISNSEIRRHDRSNYSDRKN